MELEIEPEPTDAERKAIEIALTERDHATPPAYRSAWRQAAIRDDFPDEKDRESEPSL